MGGDLDYVIAEILVHNAISFHWYTEGQILSVKERNGSSQGLPSTGLSPRNKRRALIAVLGRGSSTRLGATSILAWLYRILKVLENEGQGD